ncbi:hypothetical protein DXU07_06905 [Bradyrhizobium elkanii]|jgi:hypothetical protein|nr:hypothetical protein XI02_12855 [Bradyrhizobium sp. CCBAU 21365]
MMRPYSKDIRERALARADAGEMVRSIAEALQSPSYAPDHRIFLPPYSPDRNPIEHVFAKLKHLVRAAEPRDVEATWRKVGELLDLLPGGVHQLLQKPRLCFRVNTSCSSRLEVKGHREQAQSSASTSCRLRKARRGKRRPHARPATALRSATARAPHCSRRWQLGQRIWSRS